MASQHPLKVSQSCELGRLKLGKDMESQRQMNLKGEEAKNNKMRLTLRNKILDFKNSIKEGILNFKSSLLVRILRDCRSVNDLRFELMEWLTDRAMDIAPKDVRGYWFKYHLPAPLPKVLNENALPARFRAFMRKQRTG